MIPNIVKYVKRIWQSIRNRNVNKNESTKRKEELLSKENLNEELRLKAKFFELKIYESLLSEREAILNEKEAILGEMIVFWQEKMSLESK